MDTKPQAEDYDDIDAYFDAIIEWRDPGALAKRARYGTHTKLYYYPESSPDY
jgi:hypothetical protein